jgi:TrmH family RNA methyltransferase
VRSDADPAIIRSRSNPSIKRVGAVRAGKLPGLVLEGDRLIDDARRAGLALELILVAESREERARELEAAGTAVQRVGDGLLASASELATSPGILAIGAPPPARPAAGLEDGPRALVLVAAGVADPGNLGALARSAEAAGAQALCVVSGGASPWNSKALRGSMGSLLRLPVHVFRDAGGCARELGSRGFRQVRAATRGGVPMARFDWSGPIALWVGSETGELPGAAAELEAVTIPMRGAAESLNVAVAASLLLYASGRAGEGAERAP